MPMPPDTILLLHSPQCSPYGFLTRLLDKPVNEDELVIPWTIDNKYYTAQVNIQVLELEEDGVLPSGVEVLLYLYDQASQTGAGGCNVGSIPYSLTQSMASEPKDIALAVRIKDAGREGQDGDGDIDLAPSSASEEWQDMFEELGMEVVDETAQPEDDDERPISPIETVRQTLMTHLWTGMQRKTMDNGRAANPLPAHRDLDADDVEDDEDEAGPSTFPISFNVGDQAIGTGNMEQGLDDVDAATAFPGLAELRQQIEMDEFDRFERTGELAGGGLGRLDMLDELLGATPGEDEYARLDEWLDDDDDGYDNSGDGGFAPLGEEAGEEGGRPDGETGLKREEMGEATDSSSGHAETIPGEPASARDDTFDDDFDDFAAFQSAPRAGHSNGQARDSPTTLDPTPLLYHLQSVRTELAGLSEDERRIRAAKEVARVMRDLGFDDAEGDLFADVDGDEADLRS